MRVLAKIDSLSKNEGYLTGGQTLETTGYGFGVDNSAVSIDIDGVSCNVLSTTNTLITCQT